MVILSRLVPCRRCRRYSASSCFNKAACWLAGVLAAGFREGQSHMVHKKGGLVPQLREEAMERLGPHDPHPRAVQI